MTFRPPRIVTRVTRISRLTQTDWDDIWALTGEFFDVEREYSETELRRCQRIATFRMDGALVGMAALDVYPAQFRGRKLTVQWSGGPKSTMRIRAIDKAQLAFQVGKPWKRIACAEFEANIRTP